MTIKISKKIKGYSVAKPEDAAALIPSVGPDPRDVIVVPKAGAMEVRAAVINLNDRTYQIRNGTGIGVFAAQFGPRRAVFGGIKWELPFLTPTSTR